jgi:hypothetical protein
MVDTAADFVTTVLDTVDINDVTDILNFWFWLIVYRLSVLWVSCNLLDLFLRLFNSNQWLVLPTSSGRLTNHTVWVIVFSFAYASIMDRKNCCTNWTTPFLFSVFLCWLYEWFTGICDSAFELTLCLWYYWYYLYFIVLFGCASTH